jgi:cyclic dehypoxanthinyl futalosine synthase
MIRKRAKDRLGKKEARSLFRKADLLGLGSWADTVRKALHPEEICTFVVDRNINYTNVCLNRCTFCAFWRDEGSEDAYLLDRQTIFRKIEETISLGGTQILLQGGLHPALGIRYYINLLSAIKASFDIHVHGFSPPEICYIADSSDLTVRETLSILKASGLDSIPGGGAEILSDRVREILSPRKIKSSRWLEVMEEAHRLGMRTTATMMFGSIETDEDIIEHLDAIRQLQDRTGGFTAFIPWSFQAGNTELVQGSGFRIQDSATAVEYLRVLALSRIYLDNIENIQASWVTQGLKMAQVALRFGANDFGSTMIEENVVASAGVSYTVSMKDIIHSIRSADFVPAQRDTYYNLLRFF